MFLFFCHGLTWTCLDAGGSEVELFQWIGFGLKNVGFVADGWRAVLLTFAAVVEVSTRLGIRGTRKRVTPVVTNDSLTDDNADRYLINMSVCMSFTKQSKSLGPVHPAAHCMWQQSLGRGPLHRRQPVEHLVRVTLNQNVNSMSYTSSEIQIVSMSNRAHDSNSRVWQSCAVSPQHLLPQTEEQLGPAPGETPATTNKESSHDRTT